MIEYDQLCCILSEDFLSISQNIMIEDKENIHKTQYVNIDDGKRRGLIRQLYRFDLEEKEFLPFLTKQIIHQKGYVNFVIIFYLLDIGVKLIFYLLN